MSQLATVAEPSALVNAILTNPGALDALRGALRLDGAVVAEKPGVSAEKGGAVGAGAGGGAFAHGEAFGSAGDDSGGDWAECSSGESGDSGDGGSVAAWDLGGVEVPGGAPEVSATVRKLQFGGMADCYGDGGVLEREGQGSESSGFMKSCVRVAHVGALKAFVEQRAMVRIPKRAMVQFALCAYTQGTVPAAFVDGKRRLSQMVIVGDAALTLHVVMGVVARKKGVEDVQNARSKHTSNRALSRVCVRSGMSACVLYAAGVDPNVSKASADAVEAVVGFLAMYRGEAAVAQFLRALQLL